MYCRFYHGIIFYSIIRYFDLILDCTNIFFKSGPVPSEVSFPHLQIDYCLWKSGHCFDLVHFSTASITLRWRFISLESQEHSTNLPGIIDLHQNGAHRAQACSFIWEDTYHECASMTSWRTRCIPLVIRSGADGVQGMQRKSALLGCCHLASRLIANWFLYL